MSMTKCYTLAFKKKIFLTFYKKEGFFTYKKAFIDIKIKECIVNYTR